MLPAERELVEKVHSLSLRPDDGNFLDLAALRLRNIIEKYSEQCKRDALDRSGDEGRPTSDACRKLEIFRAALEACRARLSTGADDR
ncbi:MAG: hypothetical protein KGY48_06080 [Wenzhouxiangellaceae bacterium]|nr:hypothetical protein [Wenzhouxiangellaceae bacterium]